MGRKFFGQDEADGIETSRNSERRNAFRVQTVLRVGRVITNGDQGLVRVRNISDEGARLSLQIPVMLGEALTLELAENVQMTGHVVWTNGDNCGLKFDQHIDCGRLLASLAAFSEKATNRPIRIPVAKSAVTRGENGLRVAEVTDISQRGMKLRHDGSFAEGLHVKVTLPCGLARCGVVRWSEGDIAGLMLLEPFSAEELGSARKL